MPIDRLVSSDKRQARSASDGTSGRDHLVSDMSAIGRGRTGIGVVRGTAAPSATGRRGSGRRMPPPGAGGGEPRALALIPISRSRSANRDTPEDARPTAPSAGGQSSRARADDAASVLERPRRRGAASIGDAPNAQMSVRLSAASPRACSGLVTSGTTTITSARPGAVTGRHATIRHPPLSRDSFASHRSRGPTSPAGGS
jgi:hypothetical protein